MECACSDTPSLRFDSVTLPYCFEIPHQGGVVLGANQVYLDCSDQCQVGQTFLLHINAHQVIYLVTSLDLSHVRCFGRVRWLPVSLCLRICCSDNWQCSVFRYLVPQQISYALPVHNSMYWRFNYIGKSLQLLRTCACCVLKYGVACCTQATGYGCLNEALFYVLMAFGFVGQASDCIRYLIYNLLMY